MVGYTYGSSGGAYHAFLYSNGTMQDLGSLGGDGGVAYGINAGGQIVGYASTAAGACHAFLYSNGAMTDLGTLGGDESGVRHQRERAGGWLFLYLRGH